jgi:bzd-type benzoyl-CoA reductase N subunit
MAREKTGLARAREIYQDPARRAIELKAQGKKIVGYICIYPPLEMMTALGLVPYRIYGDMREPITKADTIFITVTCPFIRSYLDLGLKGRYDFLDGLVGAHVCDCGEKVPHVWRGHIDTPYFHYIDVPHTAHEAAEAFFKGKLDYFKTTLQSFTSKQLSRESLIKAIEAHNRQRTLVRELYDLRKPDPPLVSGKETLQVIKALTSIPVEEGNELLSEVISEAKERKDGPQKKPARLLVWGSVIDDTALIDMIEDAGANVVVDDTCVGLRSYDTDVKFSDDPMDSLAHHYLAHIKCPRTFREAVYGETRKDHMADLESRFGYLNDYAKAWGANGAILQSVKYCDTHGYEVPGLKDYLDTLGIANIYLEHDYTQGCLAPLRTRVQAFLEVIG